MSTSTSNCLCSKAGPPNRKPIELPLLFLRVTVQKTTCCHSKFIQLFNKICRVLGYDEQLSESHERPDWGLCSVSCLLLSSVLMSNSGERNFTSRPGKNLAWDFVVWLPATLGDSEPCWVRLFSSASEPRVTMAAGDHRTPKSSPSTFSFLPWLPFQILSSPHGKGVSIQGGQGRHHGVRHEG